MRLTHLTVVAALLNLTLSTSFARAADDGDVTVLTESTFDDFVNQDISLVEFYAPWCGHCKALAPEYALAATDLKSNDPPIPLSEVDCTAESGLCGKHDVKGYPTLKVFRNGKATDYTGPRQRAGIVSYMKKQAGPAIRPVSSKSDIDALAQADPTNQYYILGVFGSNDKTKPSQLSASYSLIANRLRDDYVFGKVTGSGSDNAALIKQLYPSINIADGDDGLIAVLQGDATLYTGDSKQSNVEAFIRSNSVPLVGQLTQSNSEKYSKRNLPIAKLFMKIDKAGFLSKSMKYYINRLKKLAEPLNEKLSVVIADKSEYSSQLQSQYNSKPTDEYVFVIEDVVNRKNYKYEEAAGSNKFDVSKYQQFVNDFISNRLKPYVKSEVTPVDNSGPVKVVTGTTFDEIVTDDKDVLIEFYAPWCGHCKSLEPKWNELGEKLSGQPDIVVAKLDATANDYPNPPYAVAGYPTIYFKAAGKDAVKYEGGREVGELYKYVKKNATKFVAKKKGAAATGAGDAGKEEL